ncbi:uncharacterized protein LOC135842037 [Planococcus citri]|uniref:uncharacterized protein LOC135842037 n=1 Tax=Planococcus citri TaxID=170843 RepID=UPI0031F8653D
MFISNFVMWPAPPALHFFACALCFLAWVPAPAPVNAITTKSSPSLILDNSSDSSHQFVQIRPAAVNLNQQARTFLVQQKSSLSPVQQTHILDDVQKNQRVHYQGSSKAAPSSASAPSPLLGANNGFSPMSHVYQNDFQQHQHQQQAPTFNDYAYENFNPLSAAPPTLQTVVLSPQQSVPTSPTFTNGEYFSPASAAAPTRKAVLPSTLNAASTGAGTGKGVGTIYRHQNGPGGSGVGAFETPNLSSFGSSPPHYYSSAPSSHRIPFSTAGAGASAPASSVTAATASALASNVGRQNLAAAHPYSNSNGGGGGSAAGGIPVRYSGSASSPIHSYINSTAAAAGVPNNDQYPKYEPTLPASPSPSLSSLSSTATASTQHKAYITKDASGVFSPLMEKSKQAIGTAAATSDKLVKEVYLKMNPEILIARDRQKFFQRLLEGDANRNVANYNDNDNGDFESAYSLAAAAAPPKFEDGDDDDANDNRNDQTVAQNNFANVRSQFEKELLRQLKQASGAATATATAADTRLPFAFAISNASSPSGLVSEFSLPSGQKVQISKDYNRLLLEGDDGGNGGSGSGSGPGSNKIKAIVVKQLPSTTNAPKSNLLEELTKGVVPPGAEFEVIKRNKDGALEEVSKLPQNIPQKKVTFVILEEQADGTVKVQGVRGSEKESLKESGEEVDTIIKKIKQGELKLPPSTRLSPKQSPSSTSSSSSSGSGFTVSSDKKNSRLVAADEYETKSKRKSTSSGGGEIKTSKRKEPPSPLQHHWSIGGDSDSDKHFVPTPIVQSYTTTTTPESWNSDSSATATATAATATQDDQTAYQYYSSPSTFYTPPSSGGGGGDDSATAAAAILNQLSGGVDGNQSWNQSIFNSVALSDPSSAAKIAALDNLGLFHLNNSGYIASLFSALKTHQSPEASLLPTTLGHRIVQQSDHGDSYSDSDGDQRNTTSDVRFAVDDDSYETTATRNHKKDNNNLHKKRDRNVVRKTVASKKPVKETRKDNDEEESNVQETKTAEEVAAAAAGSSGENSTLSDVLKRAGFYAMARFLRQSGLDSILNDTGPFTLFIPTDKAFRTLLIQLGGPDKAEDKFKENPRLLSGLLLHHVIPGAFRVNTLQDEMTGVSLAGTQLRVNAYTTHDIEWNDITVVTVNGAKILDEKDIVIPQGIAHAIDRVMFPLPVGNLLQSLQADRENRYSNFLKILEESELSYLLTGGKTFTLFAPLNRAFTHSEFTKVLADANECKSFVLRHIVGGALYSAGMKYYQVRDSMDDGQQITLYKEAGKIKVNNAHVVTRNIPATNGVIHAIDAFL